MAGGGAVASQGPGGSLGRALAAWVRRPAAIAARHPLLLLLLYHVLQELWRRFRRWRALALGRARVLGLTDEVDTELLQCCLLSTENLLSLGRVEKRTIFTRPLREVLGGNEYLMRELTRGARQCRRRSNNCMVARWLAADERYHVLQACLNQVSSLFGANFVHFNASDGSTQEQFKSTWYCLTVATPTRPEPARCEAEGMPQGDKTQNTCTFTDMTRQPRGSLRVMVVNESEIRRIADGKLRAPSWGFFNTRHAERYRMLVDFARNFQKQLVHGTADGPANLAGGTPQASSHSSQASGFNQMHSQDGGMFKRVHSHPSLLNHARMPDTSPREKLCGDRSPMSPDQAPDDSTAATRDDGGNEECCFLRLHIPHFIGLQSRGGGFGIWPNGSGSNGSPLDVSSQEKPGGMLKHSRSAMALSSVEGGRRWLQPAGADDHSPTSAPFLRSLS